MKRDLELVLRSLEHLEQRETTGVIERLDIEGYEDRVVAYHVRRMYEGGLIDGEAVTSSTTETRLINVLPFGLTWEGHEFLDAMKDQSVARKVRQRLGGGLADIPFSASREVAILYVREKLKLT